MSSVVDLEKIELKSGGHGSFAEGACLLEAASYIAGEPWSDHPKCVSPVLTSYGIRLNDRLGDEDRQKLKVFIPGMIGTASDGQDEPRKFLAADWAIRVATSRWLDAAGLTDAAQALRALAPITSTETLWAAQDAARAARDVAYAARVKSREGLKARILAEFEKQGVKPAVADAVAAADAVAVAVADAVAVAAAVAVAVAAAAADAVAVADAAADAVAVAVAAAVAAADADAAADAVAVAGIPKYSNRWYAIYDAVYAKLREQYKTGLEGSKFAEVRAITNAEAIELLGRMVDPKAAAS